MPAISHRRPHSARVEFDGTLNLACAVGLVESLDIVIETNQYAVEGAREPRVGRIPALPRAGVDAGVDSDYCATGPDPLRTCSWLGAALKLGRPDPWLFEDLLAPYRILASGAGHPLVDG